MEQGHKRHGLCGFHQPFQPSVPFSRHSAHSRPSHSSTGRRLWREEPRPLPVIQTGSVQCLRPRCASSVPVPAQCAPHIGTPSSHWRPRRETPSVGPVTAGSGSQSGPGYGGTKWANWTDPFGAPWETHSHSAGVQRTSPVPIACSSISSLLPSPLPYFFTRLVPVKPRPTLTLDLLHICKRPHPTTTQKTTTSSLHPFLDFCPTFCLRPL